MTPEETIREALGLLRARRQRRLDRHLAVGTEEGDESLKSAGDGCAEVEAAAAWLDEAVRKMSGSAGAAGITLRGYQPKIRVGDCVMVLEDGKPIYEGHLVMVHHAATPPGTKIRVLDRAGVCREFSMPMQFSLG